MQEEDSLREMWRAELRFDSYRMALRLCTALSVVCVGFTAAGGETLRMVDASLDPLSLHPNRVFDPNSCVIIGQMFEGLIDYSSEGKLVPKLATRWERKSPTRLRFWLRKGVTFHNGEPFYAHTVVASVKSQLHAVVRSANS